MYTITGITGQIGGVMGRILLDAGQPVRAVVRNADKGRAWMDRGCEVALATIEDAASLAAAFRGAEGIFVLAPSNFDPQPGFPEARAIGAALRCALETAHPARVVYLSTIGAQVGQPNLLTQHTIIEQALSDLPMPITFLRPAWFMENCRWDVVPAREQGTIQSFLQPLDKPVPMVATADIGKLAAALLQEPWSGLTAWWNGRTAPRDSKEIAAAFTKVWAGRCKCKSCRAIPGRIFSSRRDEEPLPRMQMLNGFNEGWIEFESGETGSRKACEPRARSSRLDTIE
jgi:uncharacterized protein YbjT (DUF2867 family)